MTLSLFAGICLLCATFFWTYAQWYFLAKRFGKKPWKYTVYGFFLTTVCHIITGFSWTIWEMNKAEEFTSSDAMQPEIPEFLSFSIGCAVFLFLPTLFYWIIRWWISYDPVKTEIHDIGKNETL